MSDVFDENDIEQGVIEGMKESLSSDAVRSLIEEAKAISEHHPSKDARFFAGCVYKFLSEHFS